MLYNYSQPSCPLDEEDLFDIQEALISAVAKWKSIGTGLGIKRGKLDEIEARHSGDPSECLAEMLTTWLRRSYDVKRFGEPTWRKLTQIVSKSAAGNNPALALTIANKHLTACKYFNLQLKNKCIIYLVQLPVLLHDIIDMHTTISYMQLIVHHLKAIHKKHIYLMEVHAWQIQICMHLYLQIYIFVLPRSQFHEASCNTAKAATGATKQRQHAESAN